MRSLLGIHCTYTQSVFSQRIGYAGNKRIFLFHFQCSRQRVDGGEGGGERGEGKPQSNCGNSLLTLGSPRALGHLLDLTEVCVRVCVCDPNTFSQVCYGMQRGL